MVIKTSTARPSPKPKACAVSYLSNQHPPEGQSRGPSHFRQRRESGLQGSRVESVRVLNDVLQRLEIAQFLLSDDAHRSAEGREAGDQSEVGDPPSGVARVELVKVETSMEEES